jgi:mono/diheme cytochrome c family protein
MRKSAIVVLAGLLVVAAAAYVLILPSLGHATRGVDLDAYAGDADRGAYVLRMGGCVACHTNEDGPFLGGGPAIKTLFGTFYGPNITPDPEHGIGGMSLQEFFDALTAGLTPEGHHYFPAFPYTSYAQFDPKDIADLKAYLDTVESADVPSQPHDLLWPFSDRRLIGPCKMMEHSLAPFMPDSSQSEEWNRGAYLVEGPGHCGECHTARNVLGLKSGEALGGAGSGKFSSGGPALSGARSTIADWTEDDLTFYLSTGLKPDGDVSGSGMTDVIDHATSHLSDEDLSAIAMFLLQPHGDG